jgi:hypothetical protein
MIYSNAPEFLSSYLSRDARVIEFLNRPDFVATKLPQFVSLCFNVTSLMRAAGSRLLTALSTLPSICAAIARPECLAVLATAAPAAAHLLTQWLQEHAGTSLSCAS